MNKRFILSLVLAVVLSGVSARLAGAGDTASPLSAMAGSSFLLKLILDARTDIGVRLEAVQELGDNLNPDETAALQGFLKSRPGAQEKNMGGLRALKNNLINALKDQDRPPAGLTATLIEMFHDRGQDFVMRDYAVQHLGTWYGRGPAGSPDARTRIQAALQEALGENTSLAGTALLEMHRLSLAGPGFAGTDIDSGALRLATASDTPAVARITALQICAERGIAQALPALERFAAARGQTALQISAIAALGRLGGAKDAALLRRLESEGDMALRPALDAALRRLSQTLAGRGPT